MINKISNNPNPIPKHTAELGSEHTPKNKNKAAVIIRILFLLFIIIYCYLLISYKKIVRNVTSPVSTISKCYPILMVDLTAFHQPHSAVF